MKKQLAILLSSIVLVSCLDNKKQDDSKLIGNKVITFVIKQLPKEHDYNQDIYISGDFEGWSGGTKQFKLKKGNKNYSITIPKYQKTISFKFTQGNWESVECAENGNPIDNRTYLYKKDNDTVAVSIVNWNNPNQKNKLSTAARNVNVFAENFEIPQLHRKRKINVYLPPNYNTSFKTRYPVLYILDGQNVFDVKTSYSREWEVDETLNTLYNETGFGLIVIAINHGGDKRLNEYSAWDNEKYGKGEGELYLGFIVNTLKPEIDKQYRTKSERENTAIIGSSLGGLFAHYAVFKRLDVFSKAGIFSPSFWYAKDSFSFTKRQSNLYHTKLYFLAGDKESNTMVTNIDSIVSLIEANGFPEKNIFKKIVPNGTHSESLWKAEFKQAISWLFINE